METAARQLQTKVEAARAVLDRAAAISQDCVPIKSELSSLEIRLALATGPIFIAATAGGGARQAATSEYLRLVASEDFSGAIDTIVALAEATLRASLPARSSVGSDITRLLAVYPRGSLELLAEPALDFEVCLVCGSGMAVDAVRSSLRCRDPECGAIRDLVGTVFDDSQFYSQEGQKAKSGTFNPNRHFQFWWTHILGREPEDEICARDDPDSSERLLDSLRAIVVRDRMVLRMLTVNDVRGMLREVGQTELNKNVPLILKKLTGIGPPQVPEALAVRVENLFTKAIEIGERVRRNGRVNRNYYPYYIYRIVEALTQPSDYEIRRMLYYIYIQSRDTVDADDADWELICNELKDITYTPTDRTLGDKYPPV